MNRTNCDVGVLRPKSLIVKKNENHFENQNLDDMRILIDNLTERRL